MPLATRASAKVGALSKAKPAPSIARPRVIAGLNPFAETKALERRTPATDPENCTSEKSPARPSSNPHLAMNTGRIGPIKQITIPLTTKPAQSSQKIMLWEEDEAFSRICVFD